MSATPELDTLDCWHDVGIHDSDPCAPPTAPGSTLCAHHRAQLTEQVGV